MVSVIQQCKSAIIIYTSLPSAFLPSPHPIPPGITECQIRLLDLESNFSPLLVRWMNAEPVIQIEESQKEKNKYSILMHMCGI